MELCCSFINLSNTSIASFPLNLGGLRRRVISDLEISSAACGYVSATAFTHRKQLLPFKIQATVTETERPKWGDRNAGPNMIDIHSTEEFYNTLDEAGDRLVVVEFYGTWCASCRALFPKLCRTAAENPDVLFLKVDFNENKPMCKNLKVKVLPFFHFYRGADGLLEAFSCSFTKFQKIIDCIKLHNAAGCSIGPLVGGVRDVKVQRSLPPQRRNM